MAATKITDLLPIPAGTKQPHAYQVFGLEGGEQDSAKISSAVRGTVAKLRAAKQDSEPQIWRQAAKLVQQAQTILSDPPRKAQLDARFGIVAVPAEMPAAGNSTVAQDSPVAEERAVTGAGNNDPLAAFLPNADPLAPAPISPVSPVSPGAAADANPTAEIRPSTPHESASQSSFTETPLPPAMIPGAFGTPRPAAEQSGSLTTPMIAAQRRTTGGRRKSPLGLLIFLTLAGCLITMIAGLGYFLSFGPGTLEISQGDGRLTINTGRNRGTGQSPSAEATTGSNDATGGRDPGVSDPVMGKLNEPGTSRRQSSGKSLAADLAGMAVADPTETAQSAEPPQSDSMANPPAPQSAAPAPPPGPPADSMLPADSPASAEPAPVAEITPAADSTPPVEPTAPADSPPTTNRSQDEGQAAIEQASEAIRNADWAGMLAAAETARSKAATAEQKQLAGSLYQLVDLAVYYRGGIARALGQLEPAAVIDLTESLKASIVEAGSERISIKVNGKIKRYSLDQLPHILAFTLGSFSVDANSPTGIAAKAAYQAVSKKSLDEHRAQSIDWLKGITGEVEGADPQRVIEAIQFVY